MAKAAKKAGRPRGRPRTTPAPEAAIAEAADMWDATLIKGKTYYLGTKLFEKGKSVRITGKEKTHLEENAVNRVTVGRELQLVPKFEFEAAAG